MTEAFLAVRPLSTVDRVVLLGCGRQARTHLDLVVLNGSVESVVAFDLSPARAEAFAEEVRAALPDVKVEVVTAAEDAVGIGPGDHRGDDHHDLVRAAGVAAGSVFLNVSLDDAEEDVLLGGDHLFVDDWTLVSEDDRRLLGRLAQAGRAIAPGVAVAGATASPVRFGGGSLAGSQRVVIATGAAARGTV